MLGTFVSMMEDDFLDEEDIIAKMQYLDRVTKRHPYKPWKDNSHFFSSRVTAAIEILPDVHKKAGLALFANIIYLPDSILDEAWREVVFSLTKLLKNRSTIEFSDTFYTSVDNSELNNFSQIARLDGREDHSLNPDFPTVSELITRLHNIANVKDSNPDISDIKTLMKKKNWVILTDNSISGGSLISDIKKLSKIKDILFPSGQVPSFVKYNSDFTVPEIYAAIQITTEQALTSLKEVIPLDKVVYGIKFDDDVRVISDNCKLFHREETLKDVRKLCEWFGNQCFRNQYLAKYMKRIEINVSKGGKENYAYGWKDCGYTLVTQDNAISNSIPLINFDSESLANEHPMRKYDSPFLRVESRIFHTTSNDKEKLSKLDEWVNTHYIRMLVYPNMKV